MVLGAMRWVALGVAVWLTAAVPSALATDWSAKARFSQSVEANDNRGLKPNSPGETYEFGSQLMLSTIARMVGMRIEADADVSYRALEGPGADATSAPTDNGARVKIEKLEELTKYFLAGSVRRQDATSAQIADSGVVVANGDITTYALSAGLTRALTPLDSLTWSVQWKSVDFTSSITASPYDDVTLTSAWTRRLTPTTSLIASAQLEWLMRDDPAVPETLFARSMLGLESKLSPQLTLKGSVGAGLSRTNREAVVPPPASEPAEVSASWLADLQLIYRPTQTTEVSVGAYRTMAPSVVGEAQQRTTVGASLRQEINPASYLLLLGELNHQNSLDGLDYGTLDYFRASVTYGYRLTQDWQAQLSYRYTERDDDIGSAHSNAFFVSAVREMTVLP
jgi:hypothetical protein